jgi:hypothetical protein
MYEQKRGCSAVKRSDRMPLRPGQKFAFHFNTLPKCPIVIKDKIDNRTCPDTNQIGNEIMHTEISQADENNIITPPGNDCNCVIFPKSVKKGILLFIPPGPEVIQKKIAEDGKFDGNDAGNRNIPGEDRNK